MHRPVVTLWIANAVILPIIGFVILLTPKSPPLLSAKSLQPFVTTNLEKLPLLSNREGRQSLSPLTQSQVLQSQAKPSPRERLTATPQQLIRVSSNPSIPGTFNFAPIPPIQPIRTTIPVAIRPSPTRLMRENSSPKTQLPATPTSRRSPKPIPSPEQFRQQIAAQRLAPSPKPSAAVVTPSPSVTTTPTPLPVKPTPTIATPTPSVQFSPVQELTSEEVESLCQKFPLNSRCLNKAAVQGGGTNNSAASSRKSQAEPSPEQQLSPQEVQSLCQKFPLNSQCQHNTSARETGDRNSTVPQLEPSPEQPLSSQELQSLCQKFPLNSRCQDNKTKANADSQRP